MQADSGVYRIEEAFFLLILFHMMLLLNLATIHLSPNNKNDWLSVGLCQYVRVLHLSKLPPRAHHTLSETKLHVPINFLVAHTTFISCLCVCCRSIRLEGGPHAVLPVVQPAHPFFEQR